MRGVHDYLEQPAATEKEGALKSEILGYLSLIEERPRESFKLPEIRVGKISKDIFTDQGRQKKIGNKDGAAAVGKLDTSAMFQASSDEMSKNPAVSVSKDGCKSVRAALEHKMSGTNESITLKNYTKKRIVDIGVRETVAEKSKGSKKQTEWKWKNKGSEIAALRQFVESNERDLSGGGSIVNRRRNEATMELEKKSEELAKNLEAKEREFQVLFLSVQR